MNNCADSANRKLKAYFAELWVNIDGVYCETCTDAKPEVRQEIMVLLDRIKCLVGRSDKQ